ncbi:transmembrane protein 209 isoform X2 [Condylostylus longicornis]|nr:transmembrane protein 209 isoform X2 [Condylostylus longicornis]
MKPNFVDKGLNLHLKAKRAKQCLKWGSFNTILLGILLFDISNKCPYAHSNWFYIEYIATGIIACSVICYFGKYLYYIFGTETLHGTAEQKSLLKFDDNDKSFVIDAPKKEDNLSHNTPANVTILSWHSSFNDSGRGTPWAYNRTTPPRQSISPSQNNSWNSSMQNSSYLNGSAISSGNNTFMSPYMKYAKEEALITEEKELRQYLREVASKESTMSEPHTGHHHYNTTSINSFWNYYNAAANLLKTSIYQLSPSTVAVPSPHLKQDEIGFDVSLDVHSEIIKKISSAKLSKYVTNLRMWTSGTILQRLVDEIKKTDSALKAHGLADMKIGAVGLERLKKTAENQQFVNLHVPMLPLIVPFLDMTTNQEYLVQRIIDLGKGSCIQNYHWNSGSSYHGTKWDEHLPTDSAILFHLFCTYLDTQLMPLPQPGGRPFYNRYVVLGDKKSTAEQLAEVKNKSGCAILCTNQLRPKFNFISDNTVHNCAHDRNNLFYVIIQFLIYMKNHHECLLEGVNLGKSGINIMCIIEDK